ncbi:MAG: primosomal protein N' [Pseudonocardia sp.]|uniref:primosomal protein N' n=1 Tax=unclassified Pseudonocardia TaxID=2619320 RepID=UPI00086A5F1B|nr:MULTISPECIES: primosomal protein N' [unclassified Pseudonocardia]MBN9112734.1 primosomal protein N' [Pseudonocardia sp.]ODU99201.1 MAG: primosome assembly protein PriA [Pseudonocardia sp. SCN 73-27]
MAGPARTPTAATRAGASGSRRRAAARGEWEPAQVAPVARVAVDVPLAHLDRPFDYGVPTHLDEAAVPGVRLRVRFAGRLVDGFLLERVEESGHGGTLAWVEKVVSPEPVLTAEVAALCRAVADRYAGVFADVVRLAVPPRHARAEARRATGPADENDEAPPAGDGGAGWARYPRGSAFLSALGAGRAAHAVWQVLPGEQWAARLAEAAAATAATGRGALLVVPDQRDVDTLHAACAARFGDDGVVALSADLGPAERYRRWLRVLRGEVRVVVGTRSAAFAPLADLGLVAVWDDGDDSHSEPRAPYPQVRDVLVLRAHAAGAALLVAGYARTAEAQLLVESGWANEIVAGRGTLRAAMPRVTALEDTAGAVARDPDARVARIPAIAFEAARAALKAGRPVLVQVPRAGYVPWLSCSRCRESARCRHCAGPLALPSGAGADGAPGLPHCRWCGRVESSYRCGGCGGRALRASVTGSRRTAEELGRAFPGVGVRQSGGGTDVLAGVDAGPGIVVATPGAEPPAEGGYGAALLLDGWAMLSRPDLRVAEETLRRWLAAAALVVPHGDGGRVVVVEEAGLPVVQALVRWDPAGHAAAELAARAEVGFPPAVRMASVEGPAAAVAEIVDAAERDGAEVLGPVEIEGATPGEEPKERALLRVPRARGRALAATLAAAQATRSARKAADPVRVRMDPLQVD